MARAHRWTAPLVLFALLATLPAPSLAAKDGSDEAARQEDMVSTASRYPQKVTDAPSAVTIVTSADIGAHGYRTLADILRGVRGFYVTDDRNYSYLGVRGFGRPGDYNSRILLLVDGHRLNNNVYDQALIGREFPVDVELIDRVEVVRGPSSSLYGSSAFFAVVNVITKSGHHLDGADLSASAGSYRSFGGRASYGKQFEGWQEAILSASAYDSAGQNLFFPDMNDPATRNGISDRCDYERSHDFFAKVALGDFTIEGVHGHRKKGVPTGAFGTALGDNRTFTVDEHSYLDVKFEQELPGDVNVTARGFGDFFRYYGDYIIPPSVVNRDEAKGIWWGAEIKGTKKVLGSHIVTGGGEFRRNDRQEQKNYDVDPFNAVLDVDTNSYVWALYAQDEWRILPKLILNAGVRHDHYSNFGGTTNPRVALIWSPLATTTIKALYGQAFRAPNAYEQFYRDNVSLAANPALRPEKIKTYELVLERELGPAFRGTVSLFQYRVTNLISSVFDVATGFSTYRNIDEVKTNGAEFELEGRGENGLGGRVSYTWQQSEDGRTGEPLSNSPRHLAKAGATVPAFAARLLVSPEVQYTSRRNTDPTSLVPAAGAFAVVNVTLLSKKIVPGFEISGSVYNLLDRKYGDPWGEPDRGLVAQNGRNFRVKADYAF